MDLLDIKDYAQKTALIISTVADMQVLICNAEGMIIADSKADDSLYKEMSKLTENAVLKKMLTQRRMIISDDCKKQMDGCRRCHFKSWCDINAIIAVPIIEGGEIYGGIGIYAHEKEYVRRLMDRDKAFLEFIDRMSELLLMKMREENRTEELKKTVKQLQNHDSLTSFDEIIGSSPEMRELKCQAKRFAKSNSTILIQGESGTGKGVLARAIHTESHHGNGPFVAINCAALPENLIESELFGYEDGAFTGARRGGKIGKFELAQNGTLFLDEIGEIPIHLQAKLLRVLQDRKVQRLGSNKEIDINARIIAATNRNLDELVKNGQFREDLYYRLNVIPLYFPSLKERKSDIGELSDYFLRIYTKELQKDIVGFRDKALDVLYDYEWPGNVRELQNAIEYSVNIVTDKYIDASDLPKKIRRLEQEGEGKLVLKPLRNVEHQYIMEALRVYGTSLAGKEKAAKVLGISKATLYRKLKEMEKT